MELQRPPRAGFKRKGFVMKEVQSPKKPLIYYTGFGPVISLISGTLSVMTGVMLLVYPNAGRIVMTLLFPLWFIAHCVSRLSNLNTIRAFSGEFMYIFTLVLNIIGLVLGALMLINPWFSWLSVRYKILKGLLFFR